MQVNIEKLAATGWTGSAMTSDLQIYDRDLSGYAAAYHTAKYDSGVSVMGNHYSTLAGSGDQWMCCLDAPSLNGAFPPDGTAPPGSPIIKMIRTDGYQAGNLIFQGVRTYDPQAGQWTTPDHFLGSLSNPMSQYGYAWNGGNPVTSSDPSGFCSLEACAAGVGAFFEVSFLVVSLAGLLALSLPFDTVGATVAFSVISVDAIAEIVGASEFAEGLEALPPTAGIVSRALAATSARIPVSWSPFVRGAQLGLGVPAGGAVVEAFDQSDITTTRVYGNTLTQNWGTGTFTFTTGDLGGSFGNAALGSNQQLTGQFVYLTSSNMNASFLMNANTQTFFIDANGLDTCISCQWSDQLEE